MLIGYMRVGEADGSQARDPRRGALLAAGVDPERLFENRAAGRRDGPPGPEACPEGLRPGDPLVARKFHRLGRDLRHFVDPWHGPAGRGVASRAFAGEGAAIDTAAVGGRPVSGVFAALAEFERGQAVERTRAGLAAARARRGGRRRKMTPAELRLAQPALGRGKRGWAGRAPNRASPAGCSTATWTTRVGRGRTATSRSAVAGGRGRGEGEGMSVGTRMVKAGERDA